jgi:hypothetical protein
MKRSPSFALGLILIIAMALSVFILGCEGDQGPAGPAGPAGTTECMNCHADSSVVPAISYQWEHSQHGVGETIERNYPPCASCHTNEGFVEDITGKAFADEYMNVHKDLDNPSRIGCFTCHSPHTNLNFDLRTTAAVDLNEGDTFDYGNGNICANCHQARSPSTAIDPGGIEVTDFRWGPHHGTQSNILAGEGGYELTGYNYPDSPHTTFVTNGCPSCHMADPVGAFAGGHSMNMEYDGDDFVTGCNVTGCHSSSPLEDFEGTGQDDIQALLDELGTELRNRGLIDEDDHLIASDDTPASLTEVEAAAVWNYLLVLEDRSLGIHNTDYSTALLQNSLDSLP